MSRFIDWIKAGSHQAEVAKSASHLPVMRDAISRGMTIISKHPVHDRQRIEYIEQHPVAFWCVRKISWSAASVPLVAELDDQMIYEHPASQLLANPSQSQSAAEFYQLAYQSLASTGNAYILGVPSELKGGLGSLVFLRPDRCVPELNADGTAVEYYQYQGGTRSIRLDPSEVCHVKHAWLTHDVFGLSTLTPAWEPAALYAGASRLSRKTMDNSGGLPGMLVFEGNVQGMSDIQRKEMEDHLSRFRMDGDKFGQIMLLDAMGSTVKFVPFVGDLANLGTKDLQAAAADEICMSYGVPAILRRQGEAATYTNLPEANRMLWMDTIIPGYVNPLADALSRFLGVKIVPDLEDVSALSKLSSEVVSSLAQADWLVADEKREKMGYPSIPLGNRLMTTMGMIPLDTQIITSDANALTQHDPKLIQALTEAYTATESPATAPPEDLEKAWWLEDEGVVKAMSDVYEKSAAPAKKGRQ